MNIGQLLCRIGIHNIVGITVKWRGGGSHLGWHGCRRCHRIQNAFILGRPEGYDVDWTDSIAGPRWAYPAEKERSQKP